MSYTEQPDYVGMEELIAEIGAALWDGHIDAFEAFVEMKRRIADLEKRLAEAKDKVAHLSISNEKQISEHNITVIEWSLRLKGAQDKLAEKDKEIERMFFVVDTACGFVGAFVGGYMSAFGVGGGVKKKSPTEGK